LFSWAKTLDFANAQNIQRVSIGEGGEVEGVRSAEVDYNSRKKLRLRSEGIT
jgi:hypothetical protein